MLTDVALKNLKPKEKPYKVTDRDGMYVLVSTTGTVSFRLDYRLNGRRETVALGRYDKAGISLARPRELCVDAKRMIREGRSPAFEKHPAAHGDAIARHGDTEWAAQALCPLSTRCFCTI
jgi:hypothetical protein